MDNNLKALVNGTKLNDYQKALAYLEVKKLKQEHAEMFEALKSLTNLFAKEYDEDSIGGIKISKAKQLLNKIKENENKRMD